MIRDRDGKPYKLRGPHTFLSSQDLWGDYKVHNLHWDATVRPDAETPPAPPPKPAPPDDFLTQLEQTKPAPEPEQPRPKTRPYNSNQVHCLPSVGSGYGEPFIFECLSVEESDMAVQLVSPVECPPGSVVFPQTGTKRWWRVADCRRSGDNWLVSGFPSDYQPRFAV